MTEYFPQAAPTAPAAPSVPHSREAEEDDEEKAEEDDEFEAVLSPSRTRHATPPIRTSR